MTAGERANVLVCAGDDHVEMLTEWLHAAGFAARSWRDHEANPGTDVALTLLRWPVDVDLATLPRPIILVYEPGADLQPVVGAVAELIEVPDSNDVRSLLAWSANLGGMLREIVSSTTREPSLPTVEASDAAPPDAACAGGPGSGGAAPAESPGGSEVPAPRRNAPSLVAIGISTGGPSSLRVFFDGLRQRREPLPPMVLVQHIPPAYVDDLVQRLRDQCDYDVRCCGDNERLRDGVAYIAPGDHHVRVVQRGQDLYAVYDDQPPVRGHCPSVDVLFSSCAKLEDVGVAIMMTGMGRDGAEAMRGLRDLGWMTLGQDEATCTIYGMPRAARELDAVCRELPLLDIAPWLLAHCRRSQVAG